MPRLIYLLNIGLICMSLLSCNNKKTNETTETEVPTEEEKVQAIKEVLKQGLNKAISVLSEENGFLTDDSLKITLPAEAQGLIDNIKKLPQGNELLDRTMSQINQIAGSSIETIAPIINTAIDSMSIDEANRILLADSAAATAYLEKITRAPLQATCEPIILQSLDKKIWGDVTTRNTWTTLANNYNKLADSTIGNIANLETVELELDQFVTEKILDAIFYLIAKEEMNVRKHPATRISKSMAKSFGWIDDSK